MTSAVRSRLMVSGTSLTALLFCAHFFNDLFAGTLAALLPTLQLRFDASEVMLAAFVATLSFSSSMLQPLFGAVADRVGRRVVAAVGVITTSAILSLMGISPSPWLLLPLLLFGGLGSAAFHPSAISLARSAVSRNRGLAMGIFSAGGTFGMAMGPLVIGLFLINGWLHLTPWLMVPGILFGLLIYLLVPVQPRDPAAHKGKLFDADLFTGPVGRLCIAGVLRSISWTAIINGAPLWLVHARGLGPTSPTLFLTITIFTISGALGGILSGLVEHRFSRQVLVTGSMLAAVVPLVLMLVSTPGSALYYLCVALAGMLVNGGLPIMVVSAQDMAPHAIATVSGMMMGLTWGTAGVLYLGVGALQGAIGMNAAMAISVLPLLPGALIAYRVLGSSTTALASTPTNAP
ncbi:MAG TPA: MFS transporter [Trueperaceae bacterium]|nr:MFS transporter [Trueperaceae bacterium]